MVKEEIAYITKDKRKFSTLEEAQKHEAFLTFDNNLILLEREIKMTISVSDRDRQILFENRGLLKKFFDVETARY